MRVAVKLLWNSSPNMETIFSFIIVSLLALMSQCEGMYDAEKAGNVTALGRKGPSVFRKHAAPSGRALTWS